VAVPQLPEGDWEAGDATFEVRGEAVDPEHPERPSGDTPPDDAFLDEGPPEDGWPDNTPPDDAPDHRHTDA
jgi:hypothetical protein